MQDYSQIPANKDRLINGKLYVKGHIEEKVLPPEIPDIDIKDDHKLYWINTESDN